MNRGNPPPGSLPYTFWGVARDRSWEISHRKVTTHPAIGDTFFVCVFLCVCVVFFWGGGGAELTESESRGSKPRDHFCCSLTLVGPSTNRESYPENHLVRFMKSSGGSTEGLVIPTVLLYGRVNKFVAYIYHHFYFGVVVKLLTFLLT